MLGLHYNLTPIIASVCIQKCLTLIEILYIETAMINDKYKYMFEIINVIMSIWQCRTYH